MTVMSEDPERVKCSIMSSFWRKYIILYNIHFFSSIYCNQHTLKGEKDQELTTLAVYRRVYLEREEDRQVAKIMNSGIDTHILRIGSLTFVAVGQLFPHQFHNFHNQDYIYPIGYKIIRYYWSLTEVNKRAPYTCAIAGEFSKISHLIKKWHVYFKNFIVISKKLYLFQQYFRSYPGLNFMFSY